VDNAEGAEPDETIEQLRASFSYGSRSNLNVKFLRSLTDAEFGDFLEELFGSMTGAIDEDDASAPVDVLYRWQARAYGSPDNFRYPVRRRSHHAAEQAAGRVEAGTSHLERPLRRR